jgi:hypothetical protein
VDAMTVLVEDSAHELEDQVPYTTRDTGDSMVIEIDVPGGNRKCESPLRLRTSVSARSQACFSG